MCQMSGGLKIVFKNVCRQKFKLVCRAVSPLLVCCQVTAELSPWQKSARFFVAVGVKLPAFLSTENGRFTVGHNVVYTHCVYIAFGRISPKSCKNSINIL
jgi:hypothetical protein